MGIHGYCLFTYSHLSDSQLDMLRDQVNAELAVPYFRAPSIRLIVVRDAEGESADRRHWS